MKLIVGKQRNGPTAISRSYLHEAVCKVKNRARGRGRRAWE